jgi:membrane protease YdiL (CAAX protease family)/uncharacterized RDD family membrane protein YckC
MPPPPPGWAPEPAAGWSPAPGWGPAWASSITWRPAGFWTRVAAALINIGILGVALSIILAVIGGAAGTDAGKTPASGSYLLLVAAAQMALVGGPLTYVAIGWWSGASVGMRAMGCRVVNATTGDHPSVEQVLLRLVGSFYGAVALGAGFLWIAVDRDKRGWHDRLAGTRVVRRGMAPAGIGADSPVVDSQRPAMDAVPAPTDARTTTAPIPPRSVWTWTDVIPILILFAPAAYLSELVVVVTLRATGIGHGEHAAVSLALEVAAYAGNLGVVWLFLGLRRHVHLADLGLTTVRWRWLAAILPALAATFVVEGILAEVSEALFPPTPATQCQDIQSAYGSALPLALIGVAVVAPFVEEIIFRGVVFGWLRGRLPVPAAVVISAAIFSAAHLGYLQWSLLLPIFGIGCVLASIYHYSRSLWPGIAIHSSINTVATLVLILGHKAC